MVIGTLVIINSVIREEKVRQEKFRERSAFCRQQRRKRRT
jgi:hypothetical protein